VRSVGGDKGRLHLRMAPRPPRENPKDIFLAIPHPSDITIGMARNRFKHPDFRSFRHRLNAGHLTRCCKHVFRAYARLEPSEGWPGWLGAFLGLSCTPHPRQDWLVLSIRQGWLTFQRPELALVSSAPKCWADVSLSKRSLRPIRLQRR
jgi:hypothetical protein